MQKILLRTVPATAPMVFPTFGKLSSVRTPFPPTEGPHEKGPAVKSMNAHLTEIIHKNHDNALPFVGMNKMALYARIKRLNTCTHMH